MTIFSAADATLLRDLPYSDGDRLTKLNLAGHACPWAHYDEYRNQSALFEASGGFYPSDVAIGGERGAERVSAMRITRDFLPLLGVQPLPSRNFTADEFKPFGSEVWRRERSARAHFARGRRTP